MKELKECCGNNCGNCDTINENYSPASIYEEIDQSLLDAIREDDISQAEKDCKYLANALKDIYNILGNDPIVNGIYFNVEKLVEKYST